MYAFMMLFFNNVLGEGRHEHTSIRVEGLGFLEGDGESTQRVLGIRSVDSFLCISVSDVSFRSQCRDSLSVYRRDSFEMVFRRSRSLFRSLGSSLSQIQTNAC